MTLLKFSASINPGTRIKINLRRLWKQLMLSFAKKSLMWRFSGYQTRNISSQISLNFMSYEEYVSHSEDDEEDEENEY